MKLVEKLAILNSMEFVEVEFSSEDLICVLVENNVENYEKIAQIVPNPQDVLNDYGSTEDKIDITRLAFENCEATSFINGEFCF